MVGWLDGWMVVRTWNLGRIAIWSNGFMVGWLHGFMVRWLGLWYFGTLNSKLGVTGKGRAEKEKN